MGDDRSWGCQTGKESMSHPEKKGTSSTQKSTLVTGNLCFLGGTLAWEMGV